MMNANSKLTNASIKPCGPSAKHIQSTIGDFFVRRATDADKENTANTDPRIMGKPKKKQIIQYLEDNDSDEESDSRSKMEIVEACRTSAKDATNK